MEGARIYAENAIREKNQSLNFLKLGSRIDAVAARLETAIRMQQVVTVATTLYSSSAPLSLKSQHIRYLLILYKNGQFLFSCA